MATKRISALTAASAAALTDQIPIEDNTNATKKLTLTQVFALAASSNWSWAGTAAFGAAVTMASTLAVAGNLAVNTDKFNVTASSGNTAIAGTLAVSGAATLSGALALAGDFALATNKVTMAAATGNTAIAGTLDVTGAATLSSTLAVNGGRITLGNGTSNWVSFGTTGIGDPAFTTRSVGTKIALYDSIDGSSAGITIGVGAGGVHMTMGCSEATDSYGFKWFGGTTEIMRLQGDGKLGIGMTPTNKLDVAGTFGATGAATLGSTLAVTGSASINGGVLTLGHGTANRLGFGTAGIGDPTFTTRTAGAKVVLYDTIDGSSNGITIGVGSGGTHMTMGCAEATSSFGFKWFGGITEIMTLRGNGQLVCTAPPQIPTYLLSTLPSAVTFERGLAWCADHTGGARMVVSNGTNWIDPRTGSIAA